MSVARMGLTAVLAGLMLLTANGCRTRPRVNTGLQVLPPPGPPKVHDVTAVVPGAGEWQDLTKPVAGSRAGGTLVPIKDQRWDGVVVYFAYDSAAIGPAERPKLETLAGHLKQHLTYAVVVEGHCDDRGSEEYNRALSESRALAVRDYLATLGLDKGRLETVAYGEERPAVPDAKTEEQHQKNRRAEFVIGVRQ